jgi:alanyl aminopeptidase
MSWWNDTWLNESFATFMQEKIEAQWKPEWQTKVDDQNARSTAMWLDRLETARRIDQPVDAKQEIGNAFDGITYQKGASVLQMFNHSMGPGKFRDAVRFYLNRHANGNGTANDFLEALGEYGGPHVPESFRTFLQQAGVPQVDMALKCGGADAHIEMSQLRFRPLGAAEIGTQSWQIPVCVAYEKDGKRATQCTALNDKNRSLTLETKACPAWFLGNADEVGYYYTRYTPPALESLISSRAQLSLPEQVGLFGEIANLHAAGRVLPSEALQLASRLRDDPRRQIVSSALKLADVRLDYLPPDLRPKYAQYIQKNFGARADQLGWLPRSEDTEDDRLIRPDLVAFVAREGEDPRLIASATELTNKWLHTRSALPAETMGAIFEVAARNGDAAMHEKILTAIKAEKDEFYLQALFRALASFRQRELVEKNLQLLAAGEFDWRLAFPIIFVPQDTPALERLPLEIVKSNYDSMVAKMPRGVGSDYAAFLPYAGRAGCSTQDAEEAQTFFGPRMAKVDGGVRKLAQAVEDIKLCEARKKVQEPDLIHFFGS